MDAERNLSELTSASRTLCTVVQNAITTGVIKIQDGYESMITGPMSVVVMLTDAQPGGTFVWNGELSEDDVKVDWVETVGDEQHRTPATGVRLTHKPTGIVREAFMHGDRDKNKASAWSSLEQAVEKRAREVRA